MEDGSGRQVKVKERKAWTRDGEDMIPDSG